MKKSEQRELDHQNAVEDALRQVLDAAADLYHGDQRKKGFYTEEMRRDSVLENIGRLGLVVSECAEGMEALRKPETSEKIPPFTREEDECADAILRLLDYAKWRGLRIGPAVVAKGRFNRTRPHKHGGKQA